VQNRQSIKQRAIRAVAALGVAIAALSAASAYAAIPKALVYQDRDGVGQITITPFLPDPATGGDRIQVQLKQNGRTFSGTGYQVRLLEADPSIPDSASVDLITFNLRDSFGRVFQFRGKLQTGGIIGKLIGSGRYEQAGVGSDIDQWTIRE
jgi:hypothetical protein